MTIDYQPTDLSELTGRFDLLVGHVRSFLETDSFPSVKAHLIKYINKSSSLESEVISLRSEISNLKAMVNSEYKKNRKTSLSNATRFDGIQKWQADILVDGESSVVDASMVFELLESKYAALNEYKWLLKSNRDSATKFYGFLSGDE
jgi:hypothetical protein